MEAIEEPEVNDDNPLPAIPMEINHESEIIFPILNLPCEVRTTIYNSLDSPEYLNLRCANKQVKSEIDDVVTFHIRIDDGLYKSYRNFLKLHVESCTIDNWTHCHKTKKLPTFEFPGLLKKLTFNGQLSKRVLVHLLTTCSALESISCTHESIGQNPNLFVSIRIKRQMSNLVNLKYLHLQALRHPDTEELSVINQSVAAFLQEVFPALRSFKLDYSLSGHWAPLLLFLAWHSKSLKEIQLNVGDPTDRVATQSFYTSNPSSLLVSNALKEEVYKLKLTKFDFHDHTLNLSPAVRIAIITLLMKQHSLESLKFSSNGQLNLSQLRIIVQSNQASLQKLEIEFMNHVNDTELVPQLAQGEVMFGESLFDVVGLYLISRMDMSIFHNCANLHTLSLSPYFGAENGARRDIHIPTILNLAQLPPSLVELRLSDYTFAEGFNYKLDLLQFTLACPNLRKFVLLDAGSTIQYSFLLKEILKHCSKLKTLHVCPVIYNKAHDSKDQKELAELIKLYQVYVGIVYDPEDDLNGFEYDSV